MSKPFKITNHRIAVSNERLRSINMLGFNREPDHNSDFCSYEYPDGCRCGVGAALSPAMIKKIKALGMNSGVGPAMLVSHDICRFESLEVAQITQYFHDHIAARQGYETVYEKLSSMPGTYPGKLSRKLQAFLIREADSKIDGNLYTRWIEALKTNDRRIPHPVA